MLAIHAHTALCNLKTMSSPTLQPMIHAIPTHIIMGFLGAGKTTLLNQLLAQKPAYETWAVLMNEVGKVEVDGSLITPVVQSENADIGTIVVKTVIGGCMCCTSYLPMQMGLSRLLSQARPSRLFIEATGIGHPAQLIQQLSTSHWATALSLQAVITVINATNLHDLRLLNHDIFQAQITNADLIVLSHSDVMHSEDAVALQNLLKQNYYKNQPLLNSELNSGLSAEQGYLLFEQINLPHQARPERQKNSYVKLHPISSKKL